MPADDHRREELVISRRRRVVDDQHGGDERRAQRATQMANANVRSAAKAGPIYFPFHVQLHAKSRPHAPQQTASLFFASHSFALRRSIACVIFFCVSPPLQLRISCAGILCSTFADTTSDRSALRT
jgi:hypothetical protein